MTATGLCDCVEEFAQGLRYECFRSQTLTADRGKWTRKAIKRVCNPLKSWHRKRPVVCLSSSAGAWKDQVTHFVTSLEINRSIGENEEICQGPTDVLPSFPSLAGLS